MVILLPFVTQEGALSGSQESDAADLGDFSVLPALPSSPSSPTRRVVNSQATPRLLGFLLTRSPETLKSVSEKLGVSQQAVRQYLRGERTKPSLEWFVRFVEKLGGSVTVELASGERVGLTFRSTENWEINE